jgi:hypothetical protein
VTGHFGFLKYSATAGGAFGCRCAFDACWHRAASDQKSACCRLSAIRDDLRWELLCALARTRAPAGTRQCLYPSQLGRYLQQMKPCAFRLLNVYCSCLWTLLFLDVGFRHLRKKAAGPGRWCASARSYRSNNLVGSACNSCPVFDATRASISFPRGPVLQVSRVIV